MKAFLLLLLSLVKTISYCQINFEEITIPSDFNIESVRQSPGGEYFIQAADDDKSIYTSLNGTEWTKASLPESHHLNDIQFFSDGTPVLQGELQEHLIRRDGNWYNMQVENTQQPVECSFVKEDTLFVFQDDVLAYSLDKGQLFITLFSIEFKSNAQIAHLWKTTNHYILHLESGSSQLLLIYNEDGERILRQVLEMLGPDIVYNDCGQVLWYEPPQSNIYYLLTEPGLQLQKGFATDIFPDWTENTKITSSEGSYFLRNKNKLYSSTGCNFDWEELAMDDLIEDNTYAWFGPHEDIFLYNEGSNHYIKRDTLTNMWISYYPEINHPHVFKAGESLQDDQFVLTSNFLFHKKSGGLLWNETDSIGGLNYQIQYSPDGDLYLNRKSHLEYSNDNGSTFSIIELPQGWAPEEFNFMQVLGNDIIFISNRLSVDCFYTLNNGQDWIVAGVSFPLSTPMVKLVDNYILAVELTHYYTASKINILTNEVATEDLGDNINLGFGATITEDGTLYFQTLNILIGDESLYRYRFGEGVKFLGHFNELTNATYLATIGNDLYGFSAFSYYLYDGETLKEYSYSGLPESNSDFSFTLADNGYVYVILDHYRIFRSVKPTVSTNETRSPMDVKISPNPANTFITVYNSQNDQLGFDSYTIYDMLGCRKIQSIAFNGNPINVDHLAPGIYTLMLKRNKNVIGMEKFIKQ